jgi:hypothetical protein
MASRKQSHRMPYVKKVNPEIARAAELILPFMAHRLGFSELKIEDSDSCQRQSLASANHLVGISPDHHGCVR